MNDDSPELSSRILKSLVVYFRSTYGREKLEETLSSAGLDPGIQTVLENESTWVSFEIGQRLIDALTEASGDPQFPRKAGHITMSREILGFFHSVLRAFGNPRLSYRKTIVDLSPMYNRAGRFELQKLGRNRVQFSYRTTTPEPNRHFCEYRLGQFESFPTIWNLPPARARELSCQARGDSCCTYEFEWVNRTAGVGTLIGAAAGGLTGGVLQAAGYPWSDWILVPVGAGAGGIIGALVDGWLKILERDSLLRHQNEDLVHSIRELQQRLGDIDRLNQTLEGKVVDRTRELQVASDKLQSALARQVELDRHKTRFFTNISHELRTPLTLILAPLETRLADPTVPPPLRMDIETAHRNGLTLLRRINALLDLSRMDAGKERLKLQETDLSELLRSHVEASQGLAEKRGIRVEFSSAAGVPTFPVDRDKIEKVFLNLLANALKFTGHSTEREARVAVRCGTSGARFFFSVEDTGTGIPEEHLEQIFERFHQVDSSTTRTYEGTGIGLSLVKELLDLHLGSVRVESTVGRGSVFTVELPMSRDAYPPERLERRQERVPVAADRRNAEDMSRLKELIQDPSSLALSDLIPPEVREISSADLSKPLVLVVDDNRDMLNFLAAALAADYRVKTAEDGEQAFRVALQEPPDIILSDMMMPRRNGQELLRDLRADSRTRHIPLILVTAKADVRAKIEGLEEGADDYLTKPFYFAELKARIRSLLNQRRLEAELKKQNEFLEKLNFDLVLSKKQVFVQTIEALAFAVEAKDPYTHGHSRRVALLTENVARQLGLSELQVERARIAAVLHDIGKLGIPEATLQKPGRLTDEELQVIKLHPVLGYRILETVTELKDVARCILHHHERYDGCGYPDCKSYSEIPLESRVIAVCDSYDAMTSDRVYRKGLGHEVAISEIVKWSGKQFDPQSVEAFLALYEKTKPVFPEFPSVLRDLTPQLMLKSEPGAVSAPALVKGVMPPR